MARILVTGGAGYIGSHTCKALAHAGHEPVVYDSLEYGFRDFVRWGPLEQGSTHDRARLAAVIGQYKPDAVMHFAAYIAAGESVVNPGKFYWNNTAGTLCLLQAMQDAGLSLLVFSSTAAVYGNPQSTPIDENHPLLPINPYAHSKLFVEQMLHDFGTAHALRSVALRYFNAAGADPDGELGECHDPETHLIPLALRAALGTGKPLTVFGADYDTPDGTPIRDYIHVSDLAEAHVAALRHLMAGGRVGDGQSRRRQGLLRARGPDRDRARARTHGADDRRAAAARRPDRAGRRSRPRRPPAVVAAALHGPRRDHRNGGELGEVPAEQGARPAVTATRAGRE